MSVDDSRTVDAIGVDETSGEVILTVTDGNPPISVWSQKWEGVRPPSLISASG